MTASWAAIAALAIGSAGLSLARSRAGETFFAVIIVTALFWLVGGVFLAS